MDLYNLVVSAKLSEGGGDEPVLIDKTISANGTYNASSDNADGYKKVVANVPNSYAAADEGKVVSNGALVSQTSVTKTANGTYDTTENNQVVVNVSGGGGSANIATATSTSVQEDSTISTVTFTGLQGEPQGFFLRCTSGLFRSTSKNYYYIIAMSYDGENYDSTAYHQSNGETNNNASSTRYSFTYDNGTLVIKSTAGKSYTGGGFYVDGGATCYSLVYVY